MIGARGLLLYRLLLAVHHQDGAQGAIGATTGVVQEVQEVMEALVVLGVAHGERRLAILLALALLLGRSHS